MDIEIGSLDQGAVRWPPTGVNRQTASGARTGAPQANPQAEFQGVLWREGADGRGKTAQPDALETVTLASRDLCAVASTQDAAGGVGAMIYKLYRMRKAKREGLCSATS